MFTQAHSSYNPYSEAAGAAAAGGNYLPTFSANVSSATLVPGPTYPTFRQPGFDSEMVEEAGLHRKVKDKSGVDTLNNIYRVMWVLPARMLHPTNKNELQGLVGDVLVAGTSISPRWQKWAGSR